MESIILITCKSNLCECEKQLPLCTALDCEFNSCLPSISSVHTSVLAELMEVVYIVCGKLEFELLVESAETVAV